MPRPGPGPALSERERQSLVQIERQLRRDRRLRSSYDAYARYGSAMPEHRSLRTVGRVLRWVAAVLVLGVFVAAAVGTVTSSGELGLVCSLLLLTAGPLLLLAALLLCPEVG